MNPLPGVANRPCYQLSEKGPSMSIIRDMRERIDALEDRECECSPPRTWADAAPYCAFWFALAALFVGIAYADAIKQPEPIRPDPSVECIKAGGEWLWWACRKPSR